MGAVADLFLPCVMTLQSELADCLSKMGAVLADNDGWENVEHNKEGVTLQKKKMPQYDRRADADKQPPMFAARGSMVIKKPAAEVWAFLKPATSILKWDNVGVAAVVEVETFDPATQGQLLHIQHKTLSAATAKRDLVVARAVSESEGRNVAYYTSSKCQDGRVKPGSFARADMIFNAMVVEPVDAGSCKVTYVQMFDVGPWVHVKFFTQDVERCALRLVKVNQQFFPSY